MLPDPSHSSSFVPSASPIRVTPAEQRVLLLMLQGLSNGSIARDLMISRRTVEGHVSTMLQKTGCRSRTQLVLWALGERQG